jgi:hypothetical protein
MMARMSRACRWLTLAGLSMLSSACGSQSTDPKELPSWIAAYPGSPSQGSGSNFVFETKDPAEKVLDFYQRQLIQSGLHMESRGGGDYGGFLSAADDSHRRNVMIDVRPNQGTSKVTITPTEKQ